MRESHCNPAEAVKIHQAVRSHRSVAVHFDTFDLADEPRDEPPKLLMDEVRRVNEDIVNMTTEVVSVADEVGELEEVKHQLGTDEALKNADISSTSSLEGDATEELIEILSPLVDFTVIKQGQRIDSLPK